jgi:hypothetical protein
LSKQPGTGFLQRENQKWGFSERRHLINLLLCILGDAGLLNIIGLYIPSQNWISRSKRYFFYCSGPDSKSGSCRIRTFLVGSDQRVKKIDLFLTCAEKYYAYEYIKNTCVTCYNKLVFTVHDHFVPKFLAEKIWYKIYGAEIRKPGLDRTFWTDGSEKIVQIRNTDFYKPVLLRTQKANYILTLAYRKCFNAFIIKDKQQKNILKKCRKHVQIKTYRSWFFRNIKQFSSLLTLSSLLNVEVLTCR